mgnify:CR=1 FL=1
MQKQVALVTGASRGIGRAIAVKLASRGIMVIVNYNGSEERAQEVVKEIQTSGGQAEAIKCNVAAADEVKEMFSAIMEKHGRIDILVNNAGITRDGLLVRMTEEEFDQVLDTNLKGAFYCIKSAARPMIKQRGGRIVNISSVSGIMGNAGQANYSASKAGLIGLTKSAARELASRGITVNAVAPGFIETDMSEALADSVKEAAMEQIPLRSFGKPEDIAEAVAFLASKENGYITGQVIHVDGGMAM